MFSLYAKLSKRNRDNYLIYPNVFEMLFIAYYTFNILNLTFIN